MSASTIEKLDHEFHSHGFYQIPWRRWGPAFGLWADSAWTELAYHQGNPHGSGGQRI